MRRTSLIALVLVAMLLVPVQAGDVTVKQQQEEDPRQQNPDRPNNLDFHRFD